MTDDCGNRTGCVPRDAAAFVHFGFFTGFAGTDGTFVASFGAGLVDALAILSPLSCCASKKSSPVGDA